MGQDGSGWVGVGQRGERASQAFCILHLRPVFRVCPLHVALPVLVSHTLFLFFTLTFFSCKSSPQYLRIWDLKLEREIKVVSFKGKIDSIALNEDSDMLALCTMDRRVRIFDLSRLAMDVLDCQVRRLRDAEGCCALNAQELCAACTLAIWLTALVTGYRNRFWSRHTTAVCMASAGRMTPSLARRTS